MIGKTTTRSSNNRSKVKANLVKLDICSCGASIFKDGVEIGKEYEVYPDSIREDYRYGCGDCGNIVFNITAIETADGGYLPLECLALRNHPGEN